MATKKPTGRIAKPHAGLFRKGNPGGPGRPPRKVEENCLAEFRRVCDPATFGKIVERVTALALSNDLRAIEILFKYAIPVPTQCIAVEASGGFRVAGMSRESIDEIAIERLRVLIAQRRGNGGD